MIFNTLGGLGLFLFGMGLMSDGLKKAAGQKLKSLLQALTKHRVIAILVGAGATALVQSSSAITVMTVGLVNAGLLTLRQSLCVVLGSNIGTTFTAWLVSALAVFKITNYAMPMICAGFLITVLTRKQKTKSLGEVILGFGLLFLGIHFMKEASSPLQGSEGVHDALIWLGGNPLLAILAGTAITMILQSSSASIMMIQTLAFQGAFGGDWDLVLRVTIPFVLGDNIGTTITAQLAALRTSRAAKRVAMGHTMFNVVGVLYILPLVWVGWFADIVEWITPFQLSKTTIMVHIAVAHSTFNVFNTLMFLPLIGLLEAMVMKVLPVTQGELARKPIVLEEHLLDTPELAMEQTKTEIIRMSRTAKTALELAIKSITEDNTKASVTVRELEDFIDLMQLDITSYLTDLSRRNLSDVVSIKLPVLLHTVNDLERVGDHAVNIVEVAERKISQKYSFSEAAMAEAETLRKEVTEMFDNVIDALEHDSVESAKEALIHESHLNNMQIEFRRSHVGRMSEGSCSAQVGLVFIDLVDNIEKIGDHLTNIAHAIIGGLQWKGIKPKMPVND